MSSSQIISAVLVCTGAWLIYRVGQVGKREIGLPPGPPTVPLLGNLHLLPTSDIHYQFTEWAKQYGDIYSLKLGPATAIVLNSATTVREIMEKQSASTADRPPNHLIHMVTGGRSMLTAPYDEDWRKLRRGAREILTPQACKQHLPIQQAEATQLMYDFLTRPKDFYTSIRRYTASVILSILFGKRAPQTTTHESASLAHELHLWERVLEPGAHPPVDAIPILKKVPERFAGWKTLCKTVRKLQRDLYFGLLEDVERRTARGETNGCFMETVCERAPAWKMDRELVGLVPQFISTFMVTAYLRASGPIALSYLGGGLLDGASDTTTFFLQSLVLALVAHPEVQKKAQEEIDRVVGLDRAPTVEDIDRLPYVQAVIRENHRFRPVAPLGVPHAAISDVIYKGYRIPKGSTIFVNVWGMFHDEQVYKNEATFYPTRYMPELESRGPESGFRENWPEDITYGCGRRICPGILLAKDSLAINTVNMLWAFDFGKASDPKTGAAVEPDIWDYAKGLGIRPNPFQCTITARSPHHADIIRRQYLEAASVFAPFEQELSEEDRRFVKEERAACYLTSG